MMPSIKLIRLVAQRRKAALELIRLQDIIAAVESRHPANQQQRIALSEAQRAYSNATKALDDEIEKGMR